MPAAKEMPRTLRRSGAKAQKTWAKTHDSAVEQYGEGERAHRTAFAALKHTFEKVGDRWAPKKKKGPSDPRARQPTAKARRAKQLGVKGTSGMRKKELARAIARKQK